MKARILILFIFLSALISAQAPVDISSQKWYAPTDTTKTYFQTYSFYDDNDSSKPFSSAYVDIDVYGSASDSVGICFGSDTTHVKWVKGQPGAIANWGWAIRKRTAKVKGSRNGIKFTLGAR